MCIDGLELRLYLERSLIWFFHPIALWYNSKSLSSSSIIFDTKILLSNFIPLNSHLTSTSLSRLFVMRDVFNLLHKRTAQPTFRIKRPSGFIAQRCIYMTNSLFDSFSINRRARVGWQGIQGHNVWNWLLLYAELIESYPSRSTFDFQYAGNWLSDWSNVWRIKRCHRSLCACVWILWKILRKYYQYSLCRMANKYIVNTLKFAMVLFDDSHFYGKIITFIYFGRIPGIFSFFFGAFQLIQFALISHSYVVFLQQRYTLPFPLSLALSAIITKNSTWWDIIFCRTVAKRKLIKTSRLNNSYENILFDLWSTFDVIYRINWYLTY